MNKKIQKTGWKEKGWWRKHINDAAPIKTMTLTGEETTVLRKTGSRVERSFLLVRGTDGWTLIIQICLLADISSKEKEMSLKVTWKVTLSCHSLSCQPAPTYSYQMKGPACRGHTEGGSSCGGRACIKLQWLLHAGRLPGGMKCRGVGFLSENVYHRVTALHGGGGTSDMKELPEAVHRGWAEADLGSGLWYRVLWEPALKAAMVKAELECWGHLESCFRLERSLDSLHSGGLHCLEWQDFLIEKNYCIKKNCLYVSVKLSSSIRFNHFLSIINKLRFYIMLSYYFQHLSTSVGSIMKSQGTETMSAYVFCKAPKIAIHKHESYNKYFMKMLFMVLKKHWIIYIKKRFLGFTHTSGSKNLSTLDEKGRLRWKLESRQVIDTETQEERK